MCLKMLAVEDVALLQQLRRANKIFLNNHYFSALILRTVKYILAFMFIFQNVLTFMQVV